MARAIIATGQSGRSGREPVHDQLVQTLVARGRLKPDRKLKQARRPAHLAD